jgi:glycosyltransferase involved in cell wall biosynthesis
VTRRRRAVVAGTFAPDYSRNRILLGLLADAGLDIEVARFDLWGDERAGLPDQPKLSLVLRALRGYPRLLLRLLTTAKPDLFVVLYPGQLDVLLVAAVGRLRGVPTIYDHFISLEETVVHDRGLRGASSATARLLRLLDRLACRAPRLVLADTPADAAYFANSADTSGDRFRVLWVGAQEDVFAPRSADVDQQLVFFHGTYIPLHGIDTIVRAAKLLEDDGIRFRLLGKGQERAAVERLVQELDVQNVELHDPVPLDELAAHIARAALCLGIFGTTAKAARVVPNKVFEYLAVGRPVLTAATPAIASAFADEVAVVPPGQPDALAAKVRLLVGNPAELSRLATAGHARFARDYARAPLTRLLAKHLAELQ